MEMLFDARLLRAMGKTFAFAHTKQQMLIVLLHLQRQRLLRFTKKQHNLENLFGLSGE